MKKLENQIIASTHIDSSGDRITKEDLKNLYAQIPDEYNLNQEHDLSRPLVAKGYNKKFAKLPDGEYAITMDIDVFDEGIFKKMGGISIAFIRKRIIANSDKEVDIEIAYNKSLFDENDIKDLIDLSAPDVRIDGLELVQKALSPVAILIILFVGSAASEFFKGFFGKAGADFYDKLKNKLRAISKKQKENNNVVFQGKIDIEVNDKKIELIIPFTSDQLDIVDKHGINLDDIIEELKGKIELYKKKRVTVVVINKPPYWEISQLS